PQPGDNLTVCDAEAHELFVLPLGKSLAMVAGNIGDQFPFAGGEAEEVGMADQMIGVFVMTGIVDEVADVVQDCRSLKNAAFPLHQPVWPGKHVKYLQGEPGHLHAVSSFDMTGVGKPENRLAPGAGSMLRRQHAVLPQAAQNQSLPDPPLIYHEKVRLAELKQFIDDHNPGNYDIGTVRVESGDGAELLEAFALQHGQQVHYVAAEDFVTMGRAVPLLATCQDHGGDGGDCPPGADDGSYSRVSPGKGLLEGFSDMAAQPFMGLRPRRFPLEKGFRQVHRPEVQGINLFHKPPDSGHQFQAAAADIDQQVSDPLHIEVVEGA